MDWKDLIIFTILFAIWACADTLKKYENKRLKNILWSIVTVTIGMVWIVIFLVRNTLLLALIGFLTSLFYIVIVIIQTIFKNKIPLKVFSQKDRVIIKRITIIMGLWGIGVSLAYLQLYLVWWILVFIVLTWVIINVVREQTKKNPSSKLDITEQEQNHPPNDKPKS
ncbi:MAG: hypothetical protein M1381_09810 [Deltaproteobacteria bacterium]|nr:hypothetical protein [Deltaproteobacteria bacterium]